MKNHDVAARKCLKCDRVFSKVEHLKRHQRSHTGERPFKCKYCGRTYARSDVLNRHIQHSHSADEEPAAAGPQTSPGVADMLEVASIQLDVDSHEGDTSVRRSPSNANETTAPQCLTPQGPIVNDSVNDEWNSTNISDIPGLGTPYSQALREYVDDNHGPELRGDQHLSQSTTIPNSQQPFDPFDPHIDVALNMAQPSVPHGVSLMMPQNVDFSSFLLDGVLLTPPAPGEHRLTHLQKDRISNEQFEQVRRVWPTRRRRATLSLSLVCWDVILLHPEDNIFSSTSLKALGSAGPTESPWGLTEACRDRLAQTMTRYTSASVKKPDNSHGASSPPYGPLNGEPPPTDILDLYLDMYFGQFQVHLPFVHPGTFKARDTPSILLFPMCLVGMMILNRGVSRRFIADYLPGAIRHCRTELTSQSLRHCPGPEVLTVLGSACLVLFIAASTAEMAFEEERQALYEEALSLSYERGLFGTRSYNSSLIEAVGDNDITWKAWSRIQSAQRLTACLVLTDVYSAHMLGTSPILSPVELHIPLMCHDELFNAHTSRKWKCLIGPGDPWSQVSSMVLDIHNLPGGLAGIGIQTALAVIWLHIVRSRRDLESQKHFEPGSRTPPYATLSREKTDNNTDPQLGYCLASAFHVYGPELKAGNTNSLILWHYQCLQLTADLGLIEDAAGRNGPEAAKVAVEGLSPWATSPGARRACLHAAQMFVIISHHRKSDGVMLHTEMALFNAALVLGFYLFTSPTYNSDDRRSYNLLEEVDWAQVETLGFYSHLPHGDVPSPTCEAAAFIRDGGPVCFNGAEYSNPYGAARRSFMNVGFQLEEVGKWNVQEYCRVLRIISDTLFTSEGQNTAS